MESEKWVQSRGSTLFDDEQGGTCLKIVGARLKKRTKKIQQKPAKEKKNKVQQPLRAGPKYIHTFFVRTCGAI